MKLFSFRTGGTTATATAVVLLGLSVVVACGDDDTGDQASGAAASDGSGLDGSVTVLAAASLTDAFDDVATAFEDANPGVSVERNYDGSSSLRDQILAGAPADVFASADASTMDAVAEGDALAGEPATFATNQLAIAVPAGNQAGVEGLEDFGDDSLLIGLCDEEVPCGDLGREVLANAGVTPAPDTNEPDVRSLLDKVESGDLDAGIVYVTDVQAAGDRVEGIEIPADDNVVTEYPIVTLAASENPDVAEAFVAFVLSPEGQDILRSHGFGPPP
jgi:molybdate transport system substrate-binding protein